MISARDAPSIIVFGLQSWCISGYISKSYRTSDTGYREGFGSLFWLSESETMSRIRRVENELPSPLRYINRSNTIGNVSHYA